MLYECIPLGMYIGRHACVCVYMHIGVYEFIYIYIPKCYFFVEAWYSLEQYIGL